MRNRAKVDFANRPYGTCKVSNNNKVKISVVIDKALYDQLLELVYTGGNSLSHVAAMIIERGLRK